MGISKLVSIIKHSVIKLKVVPQENKYGFTLLRKGKEILISAPQYHSNTEARKKGQEVISEIREGNFIDKGSYIPPEYL